MTGIWLVLLKSEVLFFAIGAVVVLISRYASNVYP